MSVHFTIEEFTYSETANGLCISNNIPEDLLTNAYKTIAVLENIRALLSDIRGKDIAMDIRSGYRSPDLNNAVGGKVKSDHVTALACDFVAPSFGSPFDVCRAILPHIDNLGIGQIIHEYGRWVHVGLPKPALEINRVITISNSGTKPGINAV